MSVTRDSRSIKLTAGTDAVAGPLYINEIRLFLTGGTVGQVYRLKDKSGGNIIAEGMVNATQMDQTIRYNCFAAEGVYVDAIPAAGSPTFILYLD